MQAHGSDRVREVAGGRILLYSLYPKNWQTRTEKTMTTSEHPGIAIFWDDAIYEVVSAESQPQGGVRYLLEPWREEHAIRVTDRYDEESEAQRIAQHKAALRREKHRIGVRLIGFLAGHLPAYVQEELAGELGLFAHRMTTMSVAMMFGVVVALILLIVHGYVSGSGIRLWQVVLLGFFTTENMIRFHIAWSQSRPIGSTVGVLFYSIAYAAGWKRGMPSPLTETRGNAVFVREEHEDTKLRDAFHLREPIVTLLTPAEQARFAARYDYDYSKHSTPIAVIILVFAVAGIITSLHTMSKGSSFGAFLSLICAAGLALEQVLRLSAFTRGPAGSVLGILARPLTRRLID